MAFRAGVSEGVFDDLFPSVEKCYRAAYKEGLRRLSRAIAEATAVEHAWLERVRVGLVAMLGFLDDEPAWAGLLLCEVPLAAAVTFECRRRLHSVLAGLLERGADVTDYQAASRNGRMAGSPDLLAALGGELVVGGVFSAIRTNLLERDGGKLVELAPSLMAFIVAPYLGQTAAQAELEGRPSGTFDVPLTEPVPGRARAISRAGALPIRVTHRTTLVLRAIARAPYSTNREVAQAAGLTDEGQTSKLLGRLERHGVIGNVGVGAVRGEPNAWLLTAAGRRTLELIDDNYAPNGLRPRGTRIRGAA